MADLLQSGAAWLASTREASASQAVTYARGYQSVSVTATFGSSLLKVNDGHGGAKVERTQRDFLIRAALLDFGSGPFLPQRGDTITCLAEDGATELVYEVAAPKGEPEWRSSDPYGVTLRIHAKFKSGGTVAPE